MSCAVRMGAVDSLSHRLHCGILLLLASPGDGGHVPPRQGSRIISVGHACWSPHSWCWPDCVLFLANLAADNVHLRGKHRAIPCRC